MTLVMGTHELGLSSAMLRKLVEVGDRLVENKFDEME